jgi:hypothetical protein
MSAAVPDFEALHAELTRRGAHFDAVTHGERHWRGVAAVGLKLAELTPGADAEVIRLFALLHDAARQTDWTRDAEHGPRAARWCAELRAGGLIVVDDDQAATLATACDQHSGGWYADPATHPTLGVCWDADRSRMRPLRPVFLSTAAAKAPEFATWAAEARRAAPPLAEVFR